LLSSAALAALAVGPALAADLRAPVYKAVPLAPLLLMVAEAPCEAGYRGASVLLHAPIAACGAADRR
jgi:hypothetical protein